MLLAVHSRAPSRAHKKCSADSPQSEKSGGPEVRRSGGTELRKLVGSQPRKSCSWIRDGELLSPVTIVRRQLWLRGKLESWLASRSPAPSSAPVKVALPGGNREAAQTSGGVRDARRGESPE